MVEYKYMKQRIFIAINIPEEIKNELISYQKELASLSARWTPKENLHITLVFIGEINSSEVSEVLRVAREIAKGHSSFYLKLNKITLGPPNKPPRMVWAQGESNSLVTALKNELEEAFLKSSKISYNQKEKRPYRPHITLARFKKEQLFKPPALKIDKDIDCSFLVDKIEVMESNLEPSGAKYLILESIKLGA